MSGDGNNGTAVQDNFKEAMRRLAGTVTIVTVSNGEERHGTTATAVTSLSMDPPSILVCFNKDSRLHAHLASAKAFCVNLLHVDNVEASRLFASPVSAEERFAGGDWRMEPDVPPYLADAQANIFCVKDKEIEYGSHTIFIGRVMRVTNRGDIAPLIYCNGSYSASTALAGR